MTSRFQPYVLARLDLISIHIRYNNNHSQECLILRLAGLLGIVVFLSTVIVMTGQSIIGALSPPILQA